MSATHKPWHLLPEPLKSMVARAVTEHGWECRRNGTGKLTLVPPADWKTIYPGSRFRGIFLPNTPHRSGHTAQNYVQQLRRWGLR